MGLVSPGVSVPIEDKSFYIPAAASTVPLFFIATKANKFQPDGVSVAAYTNEHSVVRTITSIGQSVQNYGVPYFWRDNSGAGNTVAQYHGDARNEYGLFALNQFLQVGNYAYVVRANIDLTDSPKTFISAGIPVLDANTLQYIGVGNGTISNITVPTQLHEPETFTVVCIGPQGTSGDITFTVTGTSSGMIGTVISGNSFTHDALHFTITAGSIAFQAGDYFEFSTVYEPTATAGNGVGGAMIGNGRVVLLTPELNAIAENFTIEFSNATNFTVTGYHPINGTITTTPQQGTIGGANPFIDVAGKISFTILAGTTPFAAGDVFDITFTQVHIFNRLGATDEIRRTNIVTTLRSEITSNSDVRSEVFEYNLILCPGYHEVVADLLALTDSKELENEAFVIADTPVDKTPEQVANWASTTGVDGKQSHADVAYYYPWGLASNLDGYEVVVAPSGIALKTYAYSDKAAELWWAPAGMRRGTISGVSAVGHVSGTLGLPTTFVQDNLNKGQRDILYDFYKNINPLVYFPGRGLYVWGQKTAQGSASARDRVNVERLLCHIKRQLRKSSYPFLFEPNDQTTRDDFKAMIDNFLGDIMLRRGLYDYVTLCDSSNNTPARIDRNEMWCDVAIKPMKAVEFIYIPIRVLSTGAKMPS